MKFSLEPEFLTDWLQSTLVCPSGVLLGSREQDEECLNILKTLNMEGLCEDTQAEKSYMMAFCNVDGGQRIPVQIEFIGDLTFEQLERKVKSCLGSKLCQGRGYRTEFIYRGYDPSQSDGFSMQNSLNWLLKLFNPTGNITNTELRMNVDFVSNDQP